MGGRNLPFYTLTKPVAVIVRYRAACDQDARITTVFHGEPSCGSHDRVTAAAVLARCVELVTFSDTKSGLGVMLS